MGLSIITPHYNDLEGLQQIFDCLIEQTSSDWEWIIVDDLSDKITLDKTNDWFVNLKDNSIQLIRNTKKTNASVCRNIGAEAALYDCLVFLDADDYVASDFVMNRNIEFNEFAIFKNRIVVDRNGEHEIRPSLHKNYLDCFLSAQFIWQTTSILWKKQFFIEVGKFDPNLQRLQDVELTIRALITGKKYQVIDNKIDFFYCAKPIRLQHDIVKKSCNSVNYLILKIHDNYNLDVKRKALLKSYYYACVKGLHRCKNRKDVVYVKESLKLFYKKKHINTFKYMVGFSLLCLYQYNMISNSLFIRTNRYFFK